MIKPMVISLAAAALVVTAGCGKKQSAPGLREMAVVTAAAPAAVSGLGFVERVPKDAEVFISAYGLNGILDRLAATVFGSGPGDSDEPPEAMAKRQGEIRDALAWVGDEGFLFVGPGAGEQLKMAGTTYRDLSAAWTGFVAGAILDTMGKRGDAAPDIDALAASLPSDLLEKWLDAVEKDSRIRIPSVVMGWKPDAGKQGESLAAVNARLESMLAKDTKASPVNFTASGVALAGFEMDGRALFGDAIAEARRQLAEGGGTKVLEQVSPERIERLLGALENIHLTIACGTLDGRVLIYFGNGREGFQLAETPAQSLAAAADLEWTRGFAGKRLAGLVWLSDAMVGAALPWLDSSAYWEALAGAIRPPVKEQQMIRQLLTSLAGTDRELARRETSAWSAIVCEDEGWKFESRGGWRDPSLDYTTPLRMTAAVTAATPAIRAQWVQNRERNDLVWHHVELLGVLAESVVGEFQAAGNPLSAMVPEDSVPRLMAVIRDLNRAYRSEFRAGIGDEVAFFADFQGEVPAIPGISAEWVKSGKLPRFLLARPVVDRVLLDRAGQSAAAGWRRLTAWASDQSGHHLPLILPQSIESGGLVTWYPPAPFIGGDFVPGVTLNDQWWMVGTSRSLAENFVKSTASPALENETGMTVEIDFTAIRKWAQEVYQRNKAEADALTAEAPEDVQRLANGKNLDRLQSAAGQLQGLRYRKWLADDGKPRTSLHLRLDPR